MLDLPGIVHLRHLVSQTVPLSISPFPIFIKNEFKKYSFDFKKVWNIVKLFPEKQPNGEPSSDSDAASWLLMANNAHNLETLVEFAAFCNPVSSEAGIHSYCACIVIFYFCSRWRSTDSFFAGCSMR
jgi:hypothetical protein